MKQQESAPAPEPIPGRWSQHRANRWYEQRPWPIGCNFIPSTASNQLEMWQANTFDIETIERELGYAAGLGFNTVRVYLHDLLWRGEKTGLKQRMDRFLLAAVERGIRTVFVLFDACWGNRPHLGPQSQPIPRIHNSRWVMSPSSKGLLRQSDWPSLEGYVKGVLDAFAADERVLMWDLYNEPGNEGLADSSFPLLRATVGWAREIAPTQPITVGVWEEVASMHHFPEVQQRMNEFQAVNSDIITFHSYDDLGTVENIIERLRRHGRPVVCTEYLARTMGSRFQSHLPLFWEERVGALSWGLVSGKTQTIYPWGSTFESEEPATWFHDILHPDGSPFDVEEVALIRGIAQNAASAPERHAG